MLARANRAILLSAICLGVAGMTGCGGDTTLPQSAAPTAFAASPVAITQQGGEAVSVDTTSVKFALDDTRSLVVHATITSHAPSTVTVSVRVSLYDPKHNLVGDAVGGQINVQPGATASVELTGPTPLGTIASALFEASTKPTPA